MLSGAGITSNNFYWKLTDVTQFNAVAPPAADIAYTVTRTPGSSSLPSGAGSHGGLNSGLWPPATDVDSPVQGAAQLDTATVAGSNFTITNTWSGAPSTIKPGQQFTITGTTTASGSGVNAYLVGPNSAAFAQPNNAQAVSSGNYALEDPISGQYTNTGTDVTATNHSGSYTNVMTAPVVSDFPFKHMANFVVTETANGFLVPSSAFVYLYTPEPGSAPASRPPTRLKAPELMESGGMIDDDIPVFHWAPVQGAATYEIYIVNVTPGINAANAVPVHVVNWGNSLYTVGDTSSGNYLTPPLKTLNPGQAYELKVRAVDAKGQAGPWSNLRFTISEQRSTQFRIRLNYNLEAAAVIATARFVFTIQATSDVLNNAVLGPPKQIVFKGLGVGVETRLPVGFSASSGWVPLTTDVPMVLRNFNIRGEVIVGPGVSIGTVGTNLRAELIMNTSPLTTQFVSLNTTGGFGVTAAAAYYGDWVVEGLDKSLWPNYLST